MKKGFYLTGGSGSILQIEHDDGSMEIYDSVAEDVSAALTDRMDSLGEHGEIEWVEDPLCG